MRKFFYQAVTRRGDNQVGFIDAPSEQAALIELKRFELHVTKLKPDDPRWLYQLGRLAEIAIWLAGFWMIANIVVSVIL